MKVLTPKKQRFVEEYLLDLSAAKAAVREGYGPRPATAQGSRVLPDPPVGAAISEAQRARSARTTVTADEVVQVLAKIGFANMADFMRVAPDGDPYLGFSALSRG